MKYLIPDSLSLVIFVALLCSVLHAAMMQKVKELPIVKKGWITWTVNFSMALILGLLFSKHFFSLDIYTGLWVGFVCFLGASAIYEKLLKQKQKIQEEIVDVEILKESEDITDDSTRIHK